MLSGCEQVGEGKESRLIVCEAVGSAGDVKKRVSAQIPDELRFLYAVTREGREPISMALSVDMPFALEIAL